MESLPLLKRGILLHLLLRLIHRRRRCLRSSEHLRLLKLLHRLILRLSLVLRIDRLLRSLLCGLLLLISGPRRQTTGRLRRGRCR